MKTNEQEVEYMISEIAKTEMGREALARSAEAIEKSGWEREAKKFLEGDAIAGEKMPQGIPYKTLLAQLKSGILLNETYQDISHPKHHQLKLIKEKLKDILRDIEDYERLD